MDKKKWIKLGKKNVRADFFLERVSDREFLELVLVLLDYLVVLRTSTIY